MQSYLLSLLLLLFVTTCGVAMAEEEAASTQGIRHIADLLKERQEFSTLLKAVMAAELTRFLREEKPLTVLAPTDAAFAKIPSSALEELLLPENRGRLQTLIRLHIIPGHYKAGQLFGMGKAKSLSGQETPFRIVAGNYMADMAKFIEVDLEAPNGLVHVIDRVLVPLE